MLNEVEMTVANFDCIPKRQIKVVSKYVGFLSTKTKRHGYREAEKVCELDESRFCALVNHPKTGSMSKQVLSRAVRRRIDRLKLINNRLVIIVDATIKRRRGKGVENTQRYHSGSSFVIGHKFINFVLLDGQSGVIPLETIPHLTKKYCRQNSISYRTEIEIVEEWIRSLVDKGIFSAEQLTKAMFLFDSGYDAKSIQRAVRDIGGDFVMALKSSRTIKGQKVSNLFRFSRRWLKWESIRLKAAGSGRRSRRNYSIRTASGVVMKGFGLVHVVCSKQDHNRNKPRKYLATSCLKMKGREIVKWYGFRWKIELWHKEIKQNYGFIDCHSRRFTATASHINFVLTAYLLQKESGKPQMGIEEVIRLRELKRIHIELSKFGSNQRLRAQVAEALQAAIA